MKTILMDKVTLYKEAIDMPKPIKKRSGYIDTSDANVFTINVNTGEFKSFDNPGMAIVYAKRINGNRDVPRVVVCVQTKNTFSMI
jgi:hypothetical protein